MGATPQRHRRVVASLSPTDGEPVVVNASAVAIAGRSVWSGAMVHYTGEFWFPVKVDDFWQLIENFDRYQEWWPWLQEFTADRAGLVAGNVLTGTVVPPVPYRLRLQARLHSCQRPSVTEATIAGDLRGHASVAFDELRGGTRVRAAWTLEMASAPMRIAARVARPLARWGHDRVVEMALTGICRRGIAVDVH